MSPQGDRIAFVLNQSGSEVWPYKNLLPTAPHSSRRTTSARRARFPGVRRPPIADGTNRGCVMAKGEGWD